jgi:hypothetical protein
MGNMPAQQVMGPASVHGTLSLTAWCNDVQCCLHGMFIIVISNDDLEQRLTLLPTLCKGVRQQSCSIGYVPSTLLAKPLTELTTIWLYNIMDGVPPGDVTGCSLSVIVPCHGHLATWHSITVFIGDVFFLFLCLRFSFISTD